MKSVTNDQNDNGARAASVNNLTIFNGLQSELFLSDLETALDCLLRVVWEVGVFDDELMQVVAQKISTIDPPMTVVNPEKGTFRPRLREIISLGVRNVQNNRNAILVVVTR